LKKIPALIFGFLSVLVSTALLPREGHLPSGSPTVLETARRKIAEEFARIDIELKRATERLGAEGLTGYGARSALEDLYNAFPYAIDCTAVDASGRMITVEPAPYRHVEGSDISDQEQVKRLLDRRIPVLSGVFMTVEGIEAVDAEYPVTTPDGTFVGAVSLLFIPEKMLTDLLSADGKVPAVFVAETNGRILFHPDRAQIGMILSPATETGDAVSAASASLYETVWNIFLIK
jgi:hypothetical protein